MKFCIAIGKTVGPNSPLLFSGDFTENMEKVKAMGYDAVEIHVPSTKDLDVSKIKEDCNRLGLFVATLGTGTIYSTYGLYLMIEDPNKQEEIVKMVKEFIDVAAEIGSKVTIGSIKGNVPKNADRNECLNRMGKNLKIISDYAVGKNVTILLEATNRFENNVLNTGKEINEFIRQHDLRNFEILLDSFHINIEEKNLKTCLRDAGEYLGHIHFGDNTRWYPGSGSFNYELFNKNIKETGYNGVLSVECLPLPDGVTAAEKSIEFFKKNFS